MPIREYLILHRPKLESASTEKCEHCRGSSITLQQHHSVSDFDPATIFPWSWRCSWAQSYVTVTELRSTASSIRRRISATNEDSSLRRGTSDLRHLWRWIWFALNAHHHHHRHRNRSIDTGAMAAKEPRYLRNRYARVQETRGLAALYRRLPVCHSGLHTKLQLTRSSFDLEERREMTKRSEWTIGDRTPKLENWQCQLLFKYPNHQHDQH